MNYPLTMPTLSDTMSTGRLVRWVKKVGEPVKRGDCIAEVETDKAVMEVESFRDGYLAGPLAEENSELPVGVVIGYITDSLPPGSQLAPDECAPPKIGGPPAPLNSPQPPAPAATPGPVRQRLSPYARRLAREAAAPAAPPPAPQAAPTAAPTAAPAAAPAASSALRDAPRAERAWPSSARAIMARSVIKSASTPTFRLEARLAVGKIHAFARQARHSLTVLLARAAAICVREHPIFNACYGPEGLHFRNHVDIGIAVDTPDGPVAPVLRDVAGRSLDALAGSWQELRGNALKHRLRLPDYQGATFYVSNLGPFEVVRSFDALVPQGAAAILCVGAIHDEVATFTLVCDHRVVSGADAARFLTALSRRLLEGPA